MTALLPAALLVIAPALCADARAQDAPFDSVAHRGIACVYNLEFTSAENDFRELVRQRPGDPAGYFFLAMVRWWMIMIDIDDRRYDQEFYGALDGVVSMCDSLLEKNPRDVNALFFKGGALGFVGRLKFHRNDYLGAASAGRKALPLVQEALGLDPGNSDILLGSGIYDYYADVLPSEYPLLKPLMLFLPAGDRKRGLQELQAAAEKGRYASVEAEYVLLQIEFFYEKDYTRALSLALDLHGRFPANPVFHRYVGRTYVMVNNWEMAGSEFAQIIARARGPMPGYTLAVEREARYYAGMAAMLGRRYQEALEHFTRCDDISRALDREEPSGFMAMANLRMGMVYDMQGRRDLAVAQYGKVTRMKDYQDSRAQAERYLAAPYAR